MFVLTTVVTQAVELAFPVLDLLLESNPAPPVVKFKPVFEAVLTLFPTTPTFVLKPDPVFVFATVVTVAFELAFPVLDLLLEKNPPVPIVAFKPVFELVLTLFPTKAKLKFAANDGTADAASITAAAPVAINFLIIIFHLLSFWDSFV